METAGLSVASGKGWVLVSHIGLNERAVSWLSVVTLKIAD